MGMAGKVPHSKKERKREKKDAVKRAKHVNVSHRKKEREE
jgi:hypothetical protein